MENVLVRGRKRETGKESWTGKRGWKMDVVDQKAVVPLSQRHPPPVVLNHNNTSPSPSSPSSKPLLSSAITSTTTLERRARPCAPFLRLLSAATRQKYGIRATFSSCSATAKSSAAPVRTRSCHSPYLSRLQRSKSQAIRGIQQWRPRLPELWFGTGRSHRGHP